MTLGDLIPRRWAHFGSVRYEYIRWLRREWFVRPLNCGPKEWLGMDSNTERNP